MYLVRVHAEMSLDAGGGCVGGDPLGARQQTFRSPGNDEPTWEAVELSERRRHQRVVGIGLADVGRPPHVGPDRASAACRHRCWRRWRHRFEPRRWPERCDDSRKPDPRHEGSAFGRRLTGVRRCRRAATCDTSLMGSWSRPPPPANPSRRSSTSTSPTAPTAGHSPPARPASRGPTRHALRRSSHDDPGPVRQRVPDRAPEHIP